MNIANLNPSRLVAELPSREEDCVLAEPYRLEWTMDGAPRVLKIQPGFRFFPGVQKMPLVAKLFLRLVGITKLLHLCLPHDAGYHTQGGRRADPRVSLTDGLGNSMVVGRRELDILAFRIGAQEQVNSAAGRIILFVLRHFGEDAWND